MWYLSIDVCSVWMSALNCFSVVGSFVMLVRLVLISLLIVVCCLRYLLVGSDLFSFGFFSGGG